MLDKIITLEVIVKKKDLVNNIKTFISKIE